jgi:PspA/IM30 family
MVSTVPAFVVQRPPTSTTRPHSDIVVLRMNLFDRFTRVAKANLNNILKSLEDPEKIMSQALEDMQVSYEAK